MARKRGRRRRSGHPTSKASERQRKLTAECNYHSEHRRSVSFIVCGVRSIIELCSFRHRACRRVSSAGRRNRLAWVCLCAFFGCSLTRRPPPRHEAAGHLSATTCTPSHTRTLSETPSFRHLKVEMATPSVTHAQLEPSFVGQPVVLIGSLFKHTLLTFCLRSRCCATLPPSSLLDAGHDQRKCSVVCEGGKKWRLDCKKEPKKG